MVVNINIFIRMRCFIAIDPSEEAKEELLRIQEKFKKIIRGKFVEKENLHLTLKFLGEINEHEISEIKEILDKLKIEKFFASLGNCGFFSPSFIRVLWVSLNPREKFFELHEKIENSLKELRIKKENRKFEPHITLVRIKKVEREEFLKKLSEVEVGPIKFEVSSFFLKKSTLTKEGPVYENLLEFKLL